VAQLKSNHYISKMSNKF